MGLEPARILVVPRLLALLMMLPLLTIFADVVSIVGGMWIAQTYAHIRYDSFLTSVAADDRLRRRSQGPVQVDRLCGASSRSSAPTRPLDARRRRRRRQVDDRCGRDLDHPDLHVELRALAPSVRLTMHGDGQSDRPPRERLARVRRPSWSSRTAASTSSKARSRASSASPAPGKSTILRLLDGLLLPQAGHVYVRGQDICHMNEERAASSSAVRSAFRSSSRRCSIA